MFFSPSPLKFTSSYLSWITKHLFLSPCSHPVSPPSPSHFFLVIPQWMTHGLLPPCPRRTLSSSRAWALESGYCCGGDGRKTPVRRVSCIPGAYPSQWFKRLYNTPPSLLPWLLSSHTGLPVVLPVKFLSFLGTLLFSQPTTLFLQILA